MSLEIVLDSGTSGKFYPGQSLSGTVIARFTKQQKVSSAQITFRGKIDTEYIESRHGAAGNTHGPRRRAHETIRLFEMQSVLFQGPYDIVPQTFQWPFAFKIPTECNHTRTGNTSPGFIPDGPSLLPPSFEHIETTFTHDARCRVKYKLVATIQSGGLLKNHSAELPIEMSRLSLALPPRPSIFKHEFKPSPSWSSGSLREQSLTFKQRLKHMTSSDSEFKTPCIAFRAYVHFPGHLAPEQHGVIAFSVKHARVTPNDPEEPPLMLQSMRLVLKAHFAMMASKSGIPSLSGDRYCDSQAFATEAVLVFDPVQLSLADKETVLRDDFQLSEWGAASRLLGDFSTYTIRTYHRVRIEAEVRHPPTGHVFTMRTEFPFAVLDRFDGGATYPQLGNSQQQGGSTDHDLPAYDDDRPPEHESAHQGEKA